MMAFFWEGSAESPDWQETSIILAVKGNQEYYWGFSRWRPSEKNLVLRFNFVFRVSPWTTVGRREGKWHLRNTLWQKKKQTAILWARVGLVFRQKMRLSVALKRGKMQSTSLTSSFKGLCGGNGLGSRWDCHSWSSFLIMWSVGKKDIGNGDPAVQSDSSNIMRTKNTQCKREDVLVSGVCTLTALCKREREQK